MYDTAHSSHIVNFSINLIMLVAFDIDSLDKLLQALTRRNYTVIGPQLRDQAIVYDKIRGVVDLPAGWSDERVAVDCGLRRIGRECLRR